MFAFLVASAIICEWRAASNVLEANGQPMVYNHSGHELLQHQRSMHCITQHFFNSTRYLCGVTAQLNEEHECDPNDLKLCVEMTPHTPVGPPRNKVELDAHCWAYNTEMSCMDAWTQRCLTNDGQKFLQQQIGGARALMRFLCSTESTIRKDFVRQIPCWKVVSPGWSNCVDQLQLAAWEIVEHSQNVANFGENFELCCAIDAFMACVSHVGRSCSDSEGMMLKPMAWMLAHDIATCSQHDHASCTASTSYVASFLIAGLILRLAPIHLFSVLM